MTDESEMDDVLLFQAIEWSGQWGDKAKDVGNQRSLPVKYGNPDPEPFDALIKEILKANPTATHVDVWGEGWHRGTGETMSREDYE